MALSRRTALQASKNLLRNQQPCRYASHHAHEPVKESIGLGFYLTFGAIPLSYFVYQASKTSADGTESWITRKIRSYDYWLDEAKQRNELHTKMVEQAGADRLLLLGSRNPHQPRTVDVKFQEFFNTGSPYNVPAGQGSINLEKVVAHYEKVNEEQEADRVEWAEARGVIEPKKE